MRRAESERGFWTRVGLLALSFHLVLGPEDGEAQAILLQGQQSWTSEADFSSPIGLDLTVELGSGLTFHGAWATDDKRRVDVPCGGFILPGSGCEEQPVAIEARMGMVLVGWMIRIDGPSWGELHITPEVGGMVLESTWTGLETGRQVNPDGAHLVLGGRSGVRVFPSSGIPVGLEVGLVLRRSWDMTNEDCLDCGRRYADGIGHAGVTFGIVVPLGAASR